jgi:hypothetical protein
MRRIALTSAMQLIAAIVLFAAMPSILRSEPAPPTRPSWDGTRILLYDTEDAPPGYPATNPYNTLATMNSWSAPVLDHTGKPHKHGNLIQIVMDGGNLKQDPPNADGSPGGDDSIAYGNFNMMRVLGVDNSADSLGQSGLFVSWKYFIPYLPGRAYYLRLWEGKNVATAPYYQDTIEYECGTDRGGAMVQLKDGPPLDFDWKFGPSKPRPKGSEPKAKP